MFTVFFILAFCMSNACCSPLPNWTQPPCFFNGAENPLVTETLEKSLEKIKAQIKIVLYHVETRIEDMKINLCKDLPDDLLEAIHLVDYDKIGANYNSDDQYNFCRDSKPILIIMGNSYGILNQLTGYIQQLNLTAKDEYSRRILTSTQNDIYRIMCNIKITMKTTGQDKNIVVPSENLTNIFLQHGQDTLSRCEQQNAEYVTILNCKQVSKQLDILFRSLLSKDIPC